MTPEEIVETLVKIYSQDKDILRDVKRIICCKMMGLEDETTPEHIRLNLVYDDMFDLINFLDFQEWADSKKP